MESFVSVQVKEEPKEDLADEEFSVKKFKTPDDSETSPSAYRTQYADRNVHALQDNVVDKSVCGMHDSIAVSIIDRNNSRVQCSVTEEKVCEIQDSTADTSILGMKDDITDRNVQGVQSTTTDKSVHGMQDSMAGKSILGMKDNITDRNVQEVQSTTRNENVCGSQVSIADNITDRNIHGTNDRTADKDLQPLPQASFGITHPIHRKKHHSRKNKFVKPSVGDRLRHSHAEEEISSWTDDNSNTNFQALSQPTAVLPGVKVAIDVADTLSCVGNRDDLRLEKNYANSTHACVRKPTFSILDSLVKGRLTAADVIHQRQLEVGECSSDSNFSNVPSFTPKEPLTRTRLGHVTDPQTEECNSNSNFSSLPSFTPKEPLPRTRLSHVTDPQTEECNSDSNFSNLPSLAASISAFPTKNNHVVGLVIKKEPDSPEFEHPALVVNNHARSDLHQPHTSADEKTELSSEKDQVTDGSSHNLRIKLADIKTEPVESCSFMSEERQQNGSDEYHGQSEDFVKKETGFQYSSLSQVVGETEQTGENDDSDEEAERGMDSLPIHFHPNGIKKPLSRPTAITKVQILHRNGTSVNHPTAEAKVLIVPTDTRLYQCGVCLEAYMEAPQLKKHMLQHNTSGMKRPIRCGACSKMFRYCSDMLQHAVVHTGERNHRCDACQATFTKASSLKEHTKTHTGEKPFPCDQCPAQFRHSSHLTAHKRTHSGEKPYQCDICQVFFTSRSYLKLHRRIHTGERKFKCAQCCVEFNQALHLETHQRVHTGEKPFKCEICSLTYRYKSSLKSHNYKAHCLEKPYKCDSCPEAFRSPESLKTHSKLHASSEKLYKCEACPASFLSLAGLQQHKWIHTGQKPFKCAFCPAAFRDATTLKRHKVIHVGERMFKCDHCCASFSKLTHLSCHMKVHSGSEHDVGAG